MERYFKHYKGGIYKFLYAAKHSETQEQVVVYQAMYGDNQVWVRPATMFFGTKLVNGKEVQRFTEIEKPNTTGMIDVRFKKMHPNAKIPTKAHDSDYCYDCYAVSCKKVAPDVFKYGLGFALQFNDHKKHGAIAKSFSVRPRSSVWKTGMVLSNSFGVIDQNYTGEISVVFYHVNPELPRYRVGDKVCQICVETTFDIAFQEVDELDETSRGCGSYGSTGK